MPMRLSGLMSGMDTESIVSQLVEARKTKVTKAVKAQKSLKYKQDAWKDLNKKIVNLYNKSLTTLRFESSYVKKTTKVSNSNVVSVITGENAMNSVQNLRVTELAKTGFLTGGKLKAKGLDEDGYLTSADVSVTGKTTLKQLGYSGGEGNMQVKIAGEVNSLDVDENSTVDQFVSALRQVGLNANFDETNQRLFVSSKSSGADNDFVLMGTDAKGSEALAALGLGYEYADVLSKYKDIVTNSANGTISASRQEARQRGLSKEWTSLKNNRIGILQGFSADAVSAVGSELDSSSGLTISMDMSGEASRLVVKRNNSEVTDLSELSDEEWAHINAAISAAQTTLTTAANDTALTEEEKAEKLNAANSLNGWVNNQNALMALEQSFEGNSTAVGATGVPLDSNGLPKLSSIVIADINAEVQNEKQAAQDVVNKLESLQPLASDTDEEKARKAEEMTKYIASLGLGQKTAGQDAEIYLNDVQYTSNRNTFEINGLTMTVSAKTADNEVVTITTEDDTNGIYDMIKNFFKEYNSLINEMDKLYNAESAKDYEPLTDEEKEAMSDSAIEEWENKIKDSILRKDATLSTFSQAMKTIMLEGVEVDGKQMYLSSFGINTLNYFLSADNEKNAYHIDGDPDDENTANNADVLKSMIANDPDTVVSFFTQLSQKLSDKMFDLMKSREGYSSAMTVYDDKKMQTDYDDYTAKIKELEKKLADYEDKWYAKFAAMETAMAKMQNNASAVTSLLGG